MSRLVRALPLVLVAALIPSTSYAPVEPIAALAPVEVVLDGSQELVGVAVTLDATAYVSDAGAGVVYKISPAVWSRSRSPGSSAPPVSPSI
jgi:hypothetical protein